MKIDLTGTKKVTITQIKNNRYKVYEDLIKILDKFGNMAIEIKEIKERIKDENLIM